MPDDPPLHLRDLARRRSHPDGMEAFGEIVPEMPQQWVWPWAGILLTFIIAVGLWLN
jgi:hypothetical protein